MFEDLDQIHIRDLSVTQIIGINPEERETPQEILVNATLWTDIRRAAETDDIADAANYRTINKAMIRHIRSVQPMLIEHLVQELADICLATDPRIRRVEITVEKPGALRDARSVGITIRRSRATKVIITLGSNIERERHLPAAIRLLRRHREIEVLAVSRIFESESVGGPPDAPAFHNAALLASTSLDPVELRAELRDLETDLGRIRTPDPNAPRTIDLDLAYFGDRVQEFEGWSLPGSEATTAAHVAIPIADVCPEWINPKTGQTAREIAAGVRASLVRAVSHGRGRPDR